jgi:hypothetical protein
MQKNVKIICTSCVIIGHVLNEIYEIFIDLSFFKVHHDISTANLQFLKFSLYIFLDVLIHFSFILFSQQKVKELRVEENAILNPTLFF